MFLPSCLDIISAPALFLKFTLYELEDSEHEKGTVAYKCYWYVVQMSYTHLGGVDMGSRHESSKRQLLDMVILITTNAPQILLRA